MTPLWRTLSFIFKTVSLELTPMRLRGDDAPMGRRHLSPALRATSPTMGEVSLSRSTIYVHHELKSFKCKEVLTTEY